MIKNRLNHLIWQENGQLYPLLRAKLLKLAIQVIKDTKVLTNTSVVDIIITGSLANYNWTKYSDLDLHIVVDSLALDSNIELATQFYNNFKKVWNDTHNIYIKGHEVEIYIQDVNEKHNSSGVFSLLFNKWVKKPKKMSEQTLDKSYIKRKYKYLTNCILDLRHMYYNTKDNHNKVYKKAELLKNKIMKFRKHGLLKHKEMSNENIIYKALRHTGHIKLLFDIINHSYDKLYSESFKEVGKRRIWSRNTIGSANKHQKAAPTLHRKDNSRSDKVETLRNRDNGLFMLNDDEVSMVKAKYNLSDLAPDTPRNLGSTGIKIAYNNTFNCYYIQKNGTNRAKQYKPKKAKLVA